MSEKQKACVRAWQTIGAGLALLGAVALPAHAAAQQANQPAEQVAATSSDAMTVVRDAETGKLRAPNGQELQSMKLAAQARSMMRGATPAVAMEKFHVTGAHGARLTDEFMSSAVVVRNAKGGLDMQCLEPGHSAQAAHSVGSHATQPVEE
jgi:hypothetical protein